MKNLYNLPVEYDRLSYKERREVRLQYVKEQGGKCYHCKASLSEEPAENIRAMPINRRLFPDNFFKRPVHLHHCHITGLTIGAVHNRCNAVLWQYYGK